MNKQSAISSLVPSTLMYLRRSNMQGKDMTRGNVMFIWQRNVLVLLLQVARKIDINEKWGMVGYILNRCWQNGA